MGRLFCVLGSGLLVGGRALCDQVQRVAVDGARLLTLRRGPRPLHGTLALYLSRSLSRVRACAHVYLSDSAPGMHRLQTFRIVMWMKAKAKLPDDVNLHRK